MARPQAYITQILSIISQVHKLYNSQVHNRVHKVHNLTYKFNYHLQECFSFARYLRRQRGCWRIASLRIAMTEIRNDTISSILSLFDNK